MRVLLIGGGGREHAIAWKLAQSRRIEKLFAAPGNAGIADIAECIPIAVDDVAALADFAKGHRIDLTIVGPEAALAAGVVDSFKRSGLHIFGPTKEAAMLESSKAFAKAFCLRHRIPCAVSQDFSDAEAAKGYLRQQAFPLVVKANGLASGKGVIICRTLAEAEAAVEEMLVVRRFGDAGEIVVIEEFLEGEEASFIAICDGNHVLPLAASQDYKAAFDGDAGPNTGGMGAISPPPVVTEAVAHAVMERIMLPAAWGMVTEGMPFVGVLYAGLMIRDGEPRVLEFNVRFGDPETQPLMMRLKTDLADVCEAAVMGTLHRVVLEWDPRPAACVVMAAGGYPGVAEKGKVICGLVEASRLSDVAVFHAGTRRRGEDIVTDGGRVLGVAALGVDMRAALARAYEAAGMLSWEGAFFRRDIGHRAFALLRERAG